MLLKENNDILRVPINNSGKDYIIGDIHGEYLKLKCALASIGFDYSKDRLFSVGDFIDRGPDSMLCLELINEPWFYAVRGNHEDFIVDCKRQGFVDGFIARSIGAGWFLDLENIDYMYDIACELDKLPYVIEVDTVSGKIGIVHASPLGYNWGDLVQKIEEEKEKKLFGSVKDNCLWDRTFYNTCNTGLYKQRSIEGIDYVVTGHNHSITPKIVNNFYSIATIDYENNEEFEFTLLDTSNMQLI